MASFDIKKLAAYPGTPGVYLMKAKDGGIIYIGKAKNLKARIRQYFGASGDERWIIPFLQELISDIDTIVTSSEKEALLLENTLIKKHKPRFNALLKDDKTYTAIKINDRHPWPMVSLIRYKGKLKKNALYFGPYTSAHDARETIDLLQRLFPLRQCSDQEFLRRTRPCILYGMKRCSAPCVGLVSPEEYASYVQGAIQFLRGERGEVVRKLRQQMEEASEKLEFERAALFHERMLAVEQTLQAQNVDKPTRGISADVIGIFRQGSEVILSELLFEDGRLHAYQHHNFSQIMESDKELLETFLLQHYQGKEHPPREVIIPIPLENQEILEEIINQGKERTLRLVFPVRGEKRRLIEMADKNAEAAFKQKKDETAVREQMLLDLQSKLRLMRYPHRIECIDTSHLAGSLPVSSLIAFTDGLPFKERYRRYKLREVTPGDDYGALREVLLRRYQKAQGEQDLPDLLIIDGGKGHLNRALKIFQELNIVSVDLVGVAKEEGRHDLGVTAEQLFLPNAKDPVFLPPHSPILFLLQRIRDEAHRFAITYQKKRRKGAIGSALEDIPGIGPQKRRRLLRHFGSLKKIQNAKEEELQAVPGISSKDIAALRSYFSSKLN
jgi:excinuclease ABC subunit C